MANKQRDGYPEKNIHVLHPSRLQGRDANISCTGSRDGPV